MAIITPIIDLQLYEKAIADAEGNAILNHAR